MKDKSKKISEELLVINRQELNLKILKILKEYLTKNPDVRFGQALVNINILEVADLVNNLGPVCLDPFYEEPDRTLDRINAFFKKSNND